MKNSNTPNDAAYLTLASASKKYDVSLHTLRSWCSKQLVVFTKTQNKLAILESSLLELLNSKNFFLEVQ